MKKIFYGITLVLAVAMCFSLLFFPILKFDLDKVYSNHQEEIENLIQQYPFDFVIGSIHVIHHTEFYYGEFFKGKTKEQAHREFFEETLKCVKAFDCFNVLGHLDYIVRYGPYEDKTVDHQKYQDIMDEKLTSLLSDDYFHDLYRCKSE